jgi:hypothetical protein
LKITCDAAWTGSRRTRYPSRSSRRVTRSTIGQGQPGAGERAKFPPLHQSIGSLPHGVRRHPTGHHRLLIYLQPRTVRKDHVHGIPPGDRRTGGIPRCRDSTLHAMLPLGSWRQSRVLSTMKTAPAGSEGKRSHLVAVHNVVRPSPHLLRRRWFCRRSWAGVMWAPPLPRRHRASAGALPPRASQRLRAGGGVRSPPLSQGEATAWGEAVAPCPARSTATGPRDAQARGSGARALTATDAWPGRCPRPRSLGGLAPRGCGGALGVRRRGKAPSTDGPHTRPYSRGEASRDDEGGRIGGASGQGQ